MDAKLAVYGSGLESVCTHQVVHKCGGRHYPRTWRPETGSLEQATSLERPCSVNKTEKDLTSAHMGTHTHIYPHTHMNNNGLLFRTWEAVASPSFGKFWPFLAPTQISRIFSLGLRNFLRIVHCYNLYLRKPSKTCVLKVWPSGWHC